MAKTNNLTDFLTSLALKFRTKLGTSGTINPQDFESKVDDVFDAGKTSEYDAFWDAFQSNGTRTYYEEAFGGTGWNATTFKPKYTVSPTNASRMFCYCDVPNFDLRTSVFDLSNCRNYNSWIAGSHVVAVPKIDLSKTVNELGALSLFQNAKELHTVTELAFPSTAMSYSGSTSGSFTNCTALENITVTGTIMNTGFDLHWSTKLTIESVTSILTALSKDSSVASSKKITLPTTAQAKITADTTAKAQYDAAIAAGWTIAFS